MQPENVAVRVEYLVRLTYFKKSGKYYSEGEYISHHLHLLDIFREVRCMVEDTKKLPGLVDGAVEFHVLIDVPNHPHSHPALIVLEEDV